MSTPTVNIVISYDREEIVKFRNSGSVQELKKNHNDSTAIFSNNNSNFISLEHNFNSEGRTKGTFLSLEFIDPEGKFTNALSVDPLELQVPSVSLIQRLLDETTEFLSSPELSSVHTDDKIFLNARKLKLERIRDIAENPIPLTKLSREDKLSEYKDNKEFLDSVLSSSIPPTVKTVYIMYGVGDDIRTWSSTLVFNEITKVEFSFSDGIKLLKFFYTGLTEDTTSASRLALLHKFGREVLITGYSDRILNTEQNNIYEERYGRDYIDSGFSDSKPSYHKTITSGIKDYIRKGLSIDNVVVLIPDLDKIFSSVSTPKEVPSTRSKVGSLNKNFAKFKKNLILSQFLISDSPEEARSVPNSLEELTRNREIPGAVVSKSSQEEYRIAYNNSRVIKAFIKSTRFLSYTKMLESVLNRLSLAANSFLVDSDTKMEFSYYMESDFDIIELLYQKGIIPNPSKPVFIVYEKNLLNNILFGGLVQNPSFINSSEITESLKSSLSFFDIIDGFDKDLVIEASRLNFIEPQSTNSFGPQTGISEFLTDDTFTNFDLPSTRLIGNTTEISLLRSPVFSFGTKNPNILEFSLDIDSQLVTLVNGFQVIQDTSKLISNTLGPEPKNSFLVREAFSRFSEDATRGSRPTRDFITFITGLLDSDPNILDKFFGTRQFSSDSSKGDQSTKEVVKELFGGTGSSIVFSLDDNGLVSDKQIEFFWDLLIDASTEKNSNKVQVSISANEDAVVATSRIIKEVSDLLITATVKTLPQFHLSKPSRVVNKEAIVLGIEPGFSAMEGTSNTIRNRSWFSGVYNMFGYKHSITGSSVFSEFSLTKPSGSGGLI